MIERIERVSKPGLRIYRGCDALPQVQNGLGEAVGINFVAGADRAALESALADAGEQDYFEKGLEQAILTHALRLRAIDVSSFDVVEVDFHEDLTRANAI